MSYDYSDIPALMRRHPDMFTEEEIRDVEEDREEVMVCAHCGAYITEGYMIIDEAVYCSRECMEADGVSYNAFTMMEYGLDDSQDIWKEGLEVPEDEIDGFCEAHGGDTSDGYAFWNEWYCDDDLFERICEARRLEQC